MPHGGYHGNIVGLGQSGTTGGPAGMGSPPPQPKKPKLLMMHTQQEQIQTKRKAQLL